jgi:purine nucleosidase
MKKQVIIDTDPGPDDGVAILTALGSPLIEVLGVCAVAGNVPLHHTVRNVRKILELAERQDVRVFAGAETPLARPLFTAEYVHGKTGFDGYDLPGIRRKPFVSEFQLLFCPLSDGGPGVQGQAF